MTTTDLSTVNDRPPIKSRQWQTRVMLRSNEGDGYEIDRDVLMEGSIVFKNLFQVPRSANEKTPKTETTGVDAQSTITSDQSELPQSIPILTIDEDIDIDTSTNDLKLFGDLMQQIVRFRRFVKSANLEVTLEQAGVLLTLIDKYDCPSMRLILRQKMAHLAKRKPWEVLHLANDQQDLDMGRTAISHLSDALIHPTLTPSREVTLWDNLGKLSGAWQLEFLRLYIPATRLYWAKDKLALSGDLNSDFGTWANDFDPKKYQQADGTGKRKRI